MQEEDPKNLRARPPVPPAVLRPTAEPRAPTEMTERAVPSPYADPLELAPVDPGLAVPPPPPIPGSAAEGIRARAPHRRDRILILGRRRAGKTIFLARLYEALWQGARVVDGKLVRADTPSQADGVHISCRATIGEAHLRLMKIAEELRSGKWPAATLGSSAAELVVRHGSREHVVTAIDYPGEVFRKAFMLDSQDSDAVALRDAVDRAAAAILLADPAVVASGGEESHDDAFGLLKAALRIRSGPEGHDVPIAIVFTKCDVNGAFMREVGGTRAFARKHFSQLFKGVERTSVFPCAAVRTVISPLGKSVPDATRLPENVVEPLRYCIERIERGQSQRVAAQRDERRSAEAAEALAAVDRERSRSTVAWSVFAVAVTALLAAVAVAAVLLKARG